MTFIDVVKQKFVILNTPHTIHSLANKFRKIVARNRQAEQALSVSTENKARI